MTIALFETAGRFDGRIALFDLHAARMQSSAAALRLVLPSFEGLRARMERVCAERADDVVRWEGGVGVGDGDPGEWRITTRRRGSAPFVRLVVAEQQRPSGDVLAAHKTTSRAFYAAAQNAARARGADDAIVLGDDGIVLETCVGNLLWRVGDAYWTPRADGRFLPGIARSVFVAAGRRVRETAADLDAVRGAAAVFVPNAVHGARPATLEGGPPPLRDAWLDQVFAAAVASGGSAAG